MSFQSFVGTWPLFQFLNAIHGTTSWMEDQFATRPLCTHRTTQTQNRCTHTTMPLVGVEPTIPTFERAKTVHALDHGATVIDFFRLCFLLFLPSCCFFPAPTVPCLFPRIHLILSCSFFPSYASLYFSSRRDLVSLNFHCQIRSIMQTHQTASSVELSSEISARFVFT
jgi:hypothetical protein